MNHNLFIMQGAPGCGKSTFIHEHGLHDLVISPDELRTVINPRPLVYDEDTGHMERTVDFTPRTSRLAFGMADEIMAERMRRGCDVILDLTAASRKTISKLLQTADDFNYRIHYVNMQTGLTLDEVMERNRSRGLRAVPDDVVAKMYGRVESFEYHDGEHAITPEDMLAMRFSHVLNADRYAGIRVIGDVQGAWKRFHASGFDESVARDADILHVITGDINDRGDGADRMFDWIANNIDRDNLIVIRGNHDNYWRYYGNSRMSGYAGGHATKDSINDIHARSGLVGGDWKTMRRIARRTERKFTDFQAIRFHDVMYVFTHGGLEPKMLHDAYNADMDAFDVGFMASEEFQYGSGETVGIGDYRIDIDRIIEDYDDDNIIQIHGHRNEHRHKPDAFSHAYNLEQRVEYPDGALGMLDINADNAITAKLIA